MANASNYALGKIMAIGPVVVTSLRTLVRDIGQGALSTAQLLVTFVGCATLLAAGVLLSSEDVRALLEAKLSAPDALATVQPEIDSTAATTADQRAHMAADQPQQKRVAQYLARRYRVAEGAVRMLVSTAFQIGREKNLDPLLILSVVAVESSLNPFAESAVGAQGLMQVMTRVHAQRFEPHGGETAALDPIANMQVGSSILHELISRGGSVERGLQLYVGAGNMGDDGGYAGRVLGERARLQMAAAGKVDAAIASAVRAAAAPVPAPEAKPVVLPVNAGFSAPLEPALSQPPLNSTSESQHTSAASDQSV